MAEPTEDDIVGVCGICGLDSIRDRALVIGALKVGRDGLSVEANGRADTLTVF